MVSGDLTVAGNPVYAETEDQIQTKISLGNLAAATDMLLFVKARNGYVLSGIEREA